MFGFQAINVCIKIGQVGNQGLKYKVSSEISQTIAYFFGNG
jgi:hypothetical protein